MQSVGLRGYGGTIITTLVAIIGAVLLTVLAGFVSARRMDARQGMTQAWRVQLLDINRARTIFIREDTPLPTTLSIETETFLPGWWVVKNLDPQALTREIEGANWNFFYLAGEIRATAFGGDGLGALRRAVKRVLAKQEGQKFNSLELTKIVSKRFLGISFISVTAHARHIQKDIALVVARNFVKTNSIKIAPRARLHSREQKRHAEMTVEQYSALISSS